MPTRPIKQILQNREFVSVTPATSTTAAAKLMKRHHVSAVLVVDEQALLTGICTERDVVIKVVAARLDPNLIQVGAIMTEHPQTITDDKPFGNALHMMYEGGFRHVPVVDRAGRPLGILSARDARAVDAVQFEHELVRREEITIML